MLRTVSIPRLPKKMNNCRINPSRIQNSSLSNLKFKFCFSLQISLVSSQLKTFSKHVIMIGARGREFQFMTDRSDALHRISIQLSHWRISSDKPFGSRFPLSVANSHPTA